MSILQSNFYISLNFQSYWDEGNWNFVEGNETFYVNPLDGEVFANVMNISSGFDVNLSL